MTTAVDYKPAVLPNISKWLSRVAIALLSFLLVVVGGFVVATWAPDRPVSALQPRWAAPPSQFLAIMGMQVHVRDTGPRADPAPIVLLHGTGASLHVWDAWAAALESERRVVRFDMPGFGLTGPAPDHDYRIESYVKLVVALLDQLQIERCVLVGNSFGGRVAWETALAAGTRVDKLILVDASGYPSAPGSAPIAFKLAQTPVLHTLLEVTLPRGMVEASLKKAYGDPNKVTPALVERTYEISLRAGNRAALGERLKQAPTGVGIERIAQIHVPTLILWGGRDHINPLADGEHFKRDIANSELVVFDALGHLPHEEDPAVSLAPVRKFLQL